MKVCPACRRQYEDVLSFCKRDGSELVMLEKTGYCKKCECRYPLRLERCPLHGQALALDGPETVTEQNYCLVCSNEYPKEFKLCPLHGTVLQRLPEPSRETNEVPRIAVPAAFENPLIQESFSMPLPLGASELREGERAESSPLAEWSDQYLTAGHEEAPVADLPPTSRSGLLGQERVAARPVIQARSTLHGLPIPRSTAKRISFPVALGICGVALLVVAAVTMTPKLRRGEGSVAQAIPASSTTSKKSVVPSLEKRESPAVQPGKRTQQIAPNHPNYPGHTAPSKRSARGFDLLNESDDVSAPESGEQTDSGRAIRLAELQTISNKLPASPAGGAPPVPLPPVPPSAGYPGANPRILRASEPQIRGSSKISATIQNRRRTAIRRGFRYEFDIVLRETEGMGIGSRDTTLRWVSDSGTSGHSKVITPDRFAPLSSETFHITVELLGTDDGFWRGIAYYDGIGIDDLGHAVRLSLSIRLDEAFAAATAAADRPR